MIQVPARNGGTLTRPDKGETANPNGRPRKMTSAIINDLKLQGVESVTKNHVQDAYMVLLNLTKKELEEIGKDETKPILIQRTAFRLAGATPKDFDSVIERILDRAHGKPPQTFDMNHTGELALSKYILPDGTEIGI